MQRTKRFLASLGITFVILCFSLELTNDDRLVVNRWVLMNVGL